MHTQTLNRPKQQRTQLSLQSSKTSKNYNSMPLHGCPNLATASLAIQKSISTWKVDWEQNSKQWLQMDATGPNQIDDANKMLQQSPSWLKTDTDNMTFAQESIFGQERTFSLQQNCSIISTSRTSLRLKECMGINPASPGHWARAPTGTYFRPEWSWKLGMKHDAHRKWWCPPTTGCLKEHKDNAYRVNKWMVPFRGGLSAA